MKPVKPTASENARGFAIQCRGVTYKYSRSGQGLDSFDLSVVEGSVHALAGPNGAGKTTLLKLLTGFLIPEVGSIEILGRAVMDRSSGIRSEIAMLPDRPPLYPDLTAVENVIFFTSLCERSVEASTVRASLERFGLDHDAMARPARELSKGMKQKVSLAIGLEKKAPVFLLDEPTSGLDPAASAEFGRLVRELADEGKTILLASHDFMCVSRCADEVTFLNHGRRWSSVHGPLPVEDLMSRFEKLKQTEVRARS